jgi:hypothetical protein
MPYRGGGGPIVPRRNIDALFNFAHFHKEIDDRPTKLVRDASEGGPTLRKYSNKREIIRGAAGITTAAPRIAGQWGRGITGCPNDAQAEESFQPDILIFEVSRFFRAADVDCETFSVMPALMTGNWLRTAGQEMSGLTTGFSGAIALLLISGAAQFASGRDLGRDLSSVAGKLSPTDQVISLSSSSTAGGEASINRGAKSDRAAGPAGSPALTRTVSLKLDGFSDTTFLLRVPAIAAASPAAMSAAHKPMVACELVASVLTEAVKQLQPGRCVV